MMPAASAIAMAGRTLDVMRRCVCGVAAVWPLHAQADCIQLDHADTLEWSQGHTSGIALADHREVETASYDSDLYGFLVRGESGNCLKTVFADHASIADSCRDSVSGQIHTVLHTSAGQHSDVEIWSADPATGEPVRKYSEG